MPIANYGLEWSFEAGMTGKLSKNNKHTGNPVDLFFQRGVYVIHKQRKIWYVGKSAGATSSIYLRLKDHKIEGWEFDTFSWFGFYPITNAGVIDLDYKGAETELSIKNVETLLIYWGLSLDAGTRLS